MKLLAWSKKFTLWSPVADLSAGAGWGGCLGSSITDNATRGQTWGAVSKTHSAMNYGTWLNGMSWVKLLWWQNDFKCRLPSCSKGFCTSGVWAVIHTHTLQGHLSTCCLVGEYSLQSFLSGGLAVSCARDSWGKSSKCCLRFSNDRQIAISINPLSVFSKELFDKGVCRTGNTWQDSAPTQIPALKMKKTETLSIIIPVTGADSLPWKAISPLG